MYNFTTKGNHAPYSLQMTPDHRVYYTCRHSGQLRCELAENFRVGGNAMIPISGNLKGRTSELSYADRFLIALQADGTPDLRANNIGSVSGCWAASFSLTKVRKKLRLLDICNGLGAEVVYDESTLTEHHKQTFRVKVPLTAIPVPYSGKGLSWVYGKLTEVDSAWCTSFIDELVAWDGHTTKDGCRLYSSTDEPSALAAATVAHLCGIRSTVVAVDDDRSDTYKVAYKVHFSGKSHKDGQSVTKTSVDYSDDVMCLSVDSGAFMVRENGSISITGNCHANFAVLLHNNYIQDKVSNERIAEIVKEAVDLERYFVSDALPVELIGMNSKLMCQYLEYVADRLLLDLGCEKLYNATNPFPFMEQISLQPKTNFFEARVGAYRKFGDNEKEEDKQFTLDVEF